MVLLLTPAAFASWPMLTRPAVSSIAFATVPVSPPGLDGRGGGRQRLPVVYGSAPAGEQPSRVLAGADPSRIVAARAVPGDPNPQARPRTRLGTGPGPDRARAGLGPGWGTGVLRGNLGSALDAGRTQMNEAYIVGAVRPPVGKRNGGLSGVHPLDLAAHVLSEVVARTGIDPAAVDDVIMGCVSQIGAQSLDIARNAWLSAGLPESVPGVTIDRQCGSSQQAVHFAAQAVLSGTQGLVIAAGVESMSTVPMGSTVTLPLEKGMAAPFGEGWRGRYGDQEISQFRGAQLMCEKWGIKRAQLEEFSLRSHQCAVRAIDEGRFDREIAPIAGVTQDEGPRRDTSLEKMAELKPLREGWELTAATASQISDGAAALLIASPDAAKRHGLTPRA